MALAVLGALPICVSIVVEVGNAPPDIVETSRAEEEVGKPKRNNLHCSVMSSCHGSLERHSTQVVSPPPQ
eukprot:6850384-Pyramimonas_sp.AAC.1